MKKIILLFLLALLAAGPATGCRREIPIYRADATSITVKSGQQFTIALDSNPPTGLMWREDYNQTMLELTASTFELIPPELKTAESSLAQHFTFKALKKGSTQVTFKYYTPDLTHYAKEAVFSITIN